MIEVFIKTALENPVDVDSTGFYKVPKAGLEPARF